jgi:hypothetical protein
MNTPTRGPRGADALVNGAPAGGRAVNWRLLRADALLTGAPHRRARQRPPFRGPPHASAAAPAAERLTREHFGFRS